MTKSRKILAGGLVIAAAIGYLIWSGVTQSVVYFVTPSELLAAPVRLSQHALELIYAAIFCFVVTSLLLASVLWAGPPVLPVIITAIFVAGVALLIGALVLEFVEMGLSLRTIEIEMTGLPGSRRAEEPPAKRLR